MFDRLSAFAVVLLATVLLPTVLLPTGAIAQKPAAPAPQQPQEPQGKDAPSPKQRLDQNAALVEVVADALRGLAVADRRDDALATLTVLGEQVLVDELAALTRRLAKSLGVDAAATQLAIDTESRGAANLARVPTREQITEWLRDLPVAERRADARAELLNASQYTLQLASEALAQEKGAVLNRADVVAELQSLVADLGAANQRLSHARDRLFGITTTGNTLIADYSDNRVVEVDREGKIVWEMHDVFGAWDARPLPNGNVLLTEFSVSRVAEVDRKGNRVWVYENLRNPYRASRLANGNTLIADTFGGRVIEVTPAKEIAWKYDAQIRPFGAERLPNGNTLIADVLKSRVLEVDAQGATVWELGGMNIVHDAKRLANGNTLITQRQEGRVIEVDHDGKVVWELSKLINPSSAERLPNGNTLVAENNPVREFDHDGKVVWQKNMTWAVQARRY
jgi:hypothetical protein